MDARPDQEEMDQTTNKFLQQLQKQEKKGFEDLATPLSHLPKPAQGSARSIMASMSVAKAMEAGFLRGLEKDQADTFTPSELRLNRHAQDSRLLTQDIMDYPSLFGDILG